MVHEERIQLRSCRSKDFEWLYWSSVNLWQKDKVDDDDLIHPQYKP